MRSVLLLLVLMAIACDNPITDPIDPTKVAPDMTFLSVTCHNGIGQEIIMKKDGEEFRKPINDVDGNPLAKFTFDQDMGEVDCFTTMKWDRFGNEISANNLDEYQAFVKHIDDVVFGDFSFDMFEFSRFIVVRADTVYKFYINSTKKDIKFVGNKTYIYQIRDGKIPREMRMYFSPNDDEYTFFVAAQWEKHDLVVIK